MSPSYLVLFPGAEETVRNRLGDVPTLYELVEECRRRGVTRLRCGHVVARQSSLGFLLVGPAGEHAAGAGFFSQYLSVGLYHPMAGVPVMSLSSSGSYPDGYCYLSALRAGEDGVACLRLGPWPSVSQVEQLIGRSLPAGLFERVGPGLVHLRESGPLGGVAPGPLELVGGVSVNGLRLQSTVDTTVPGLAYTKSLGTDAEPGRPVMSFSTGVLNQGGRDSWTGHQNEARVAELARSVLSDGGTSGSLDLLLVWPELGTAYLEGGLALSDIPGGFVRCYPGTRQPDGCYQVRLEAEAGSVLVFPRGAVVRGQAVEVAATGRRVFAVSAMAGTYAFVLQSDTEPIVYVYQPDLKTWTGRTSGYVRQLVEKFGHIPLLGSACAVVGVYGFKMKSEDIQGRPLERRYLLTKGVGMEIGVVRYRGVPGASVVVPQVMTSVSVGGARVLSEPLVVPSTGDRADGYVVDDEGSVYSDGDSEDAFEYLSTGSSSSGFSQTREIYTLRE